MATGFKHLTVTEYYITFAIDNWDDVPKHMEVLIKLPNVPQELEDLVTGKKTEVLVSPQRMEEITTWLQHNWPKAPFEVEPWSWDLLEKENGEYLLIRAIPEESQKCLLCDILTENRDNKIRDHTKIYFIFGHVRCPICHSLIQIATHRKDITVSGCPHLKQWVFDNNELMMTLTPDNTSDIATPSNHEEHI